MSLLAETATADAGALAGPLRDLCALEFDVNQPVADLRTFSSFYKQRAMGDG